MGIGFSLFLVAAGAILAFAVEVDADGVDLETIGIILMAVGAVGVVLSVVFWSSWGVGGVRRRRIVEDEYNSSAPR